jgi:Putative transposase
MRRGEEKLPAFLHRVNCQHILSTSPAKLCILRQVPAHRRDQLERLIRSTARGAVSLERLEQDANGDLVYTFTHPWSDGTTGMRLSPVELVEKLAALVPLPRVHLVRYGGCLASHSHLRRAIIPTPRQQGGMGWADAVGGRCSNGPSRSGIIVGSDTAGEILLRIPTPRAEHSFGST